MVVFNVPLDKLQVILETIFSADHWLMQKKNPVLLTNHWLVLAKLQPSDKTKNLKQQLIKTTNINKAKPNETKAWLKLPFMPSSQEIDRA